MSSSNIEPVKFSAAPEENALRWTAKEPKHNDDGSYTCHSEKLNANFKVHIQKEGKSGAQRCHILTVHDLGFDYNEFHNLIMTHEMTDLRSRVVWIHVTLPGQSVGDADLDMRTYPSIEELGEELSFILDCFKIPQAVVVGDGAGANIAVKFAVKCPDRCLGLILIEPIASHAKFMDIVKHKMQTLNSTVFGTPGMNAHDKANVILNHIKKIDSHEHLSGSFSLTEAENRIYENRNLKNLSLFAESFLNRASLLDDIENLKIDILTITGKESTSHQETIKFYTALHEAHKLEPKSMVNSPFLEVDGLVKLNPEKLATSFQYFLQGIGLVSAMPLRRVSRTSESDPLSTSPSNKSN